MPLSTLLTNLQTILPLAVLLLWACILLLVDLAIPKEHKAWTAFLACLGLALAIVITILQAGNPPASAFNDMLRRDAFADFLSILFLASGLVAIAIAYPYLQTHDLQRGEYYTLLLFSISGMLLMAHATDLIVVFLALELLSIPLYVLAGFARPRPDSEEAALKYFLLGAFAGSFFVFGVALVFGATATTQLNGIIAALQTGAADLPLLIIGSALILVGLSFKVAVVPFHMWTPDVYQGAPSPVTAFMSVGAKAAGFAALLRIFVAALPDVAPQITMILWVIAALTMFAGNLIAIAQNNIKRMLAYSSIAHAGYILMALVPFGQSKVAADSVASALFYLLAYAITSLGAWAVVIALEKLDGQGLSIDDYTGLGRKSPLLAAAMTVFMLSFTGVPPTLGFMGKFYLFRTLLEGDFVGLALIGVFTSLISAFFYLRIVVIMYMRESQPTPEEADLRPALVPSLTITAALAAFLTVVLSLTSMPLLNWAINAARSLF